MAQPYYSAYEIGRRIEECRQQLGLTLEQAADRCGMTQQLLESIEIGVKSLQAENLLRISHGLHIGVDYIILGIDNATSNSAVFDNIDSYSDEVHIDIAYIRNRITELRLKKHTTECQMSLDLGHSKSYIGQISSGKSKPALQEFLSICEYLEVSPSDFFDVSAQNPIQIQALTKRAGLLNEDVLNDYQTDYGVISLKTRLIHYETGNTIKIKYELYEGLNLVSQVYMMISYSVLEN